jgi:lysozyme family protein
MNLSLPWTMQAGGSGSISMNFPLTRELRQQYQHLFDTCTIDPQHLASADSLVNKITNQKSRYESAGSPIGVPWYFIGAVHNMESSLRFDRHLHNGDPLTGRTIHVPPGRPVNGDPPFTWEESATDALQFEHLDQVTDWSLPGLLYQLEKYNGFGYRRLKSPILSPYLWSFSNHYTTGKFVADGTFDPDVVSGQCGAAVILRRMVDQGIVSLTSTEAEPETPGEDLTQTISRLQSQVSFSQTKKSEAAKALQVALNKIRGNALREDGIPGKLTSAAVKEVTGHFLANDPRGQAKAAS